MRESVCIVLHHSCLFRLTMPTSNLLSPLFQPNRQETHIHCQGNVCNISKKRKRINQIPESKSQSTEQIKLKILARDDNRSITCQSRYLSKDGLQSVLIDRQERFSSCKIWNNEKNYDLSTPTLKKVWEKLTHRN